MTKFLPLGFVLLLSVLSSCQKNTGLKPADIPAPARTMQEAKARLTAQNKWTIDEIIINDTVVCKIGQSNTAHEALAITIEWCQFAENGILTIQWPSESVPQKLFYKMDVANNRIVIGHDALFKDAHDWTIEADSVYSDKFYLRRGGDWGSYCFKMVPVR